MTTQLKHTPGPWEIVGTAIRGPRGDTIAACPHIGADLTLIVASPELFNAAINALVVLTDLGIDLDGEEEEIIAGIRLQLHEAIAKATGTNYDLSFA